MPSCKQLSDGGVNWVLVAGCAGGELSSLPYLEKRSTSVQNWLAQLSRGMEILKMEYQASTLGARASSYGLGKVETLRFEIRAECGLCQSRAVKVSDGL